MAFKFSKGQGSSSRRYISRLVKMLSDDHATQRELSSFFESVAMKGDLGYLNLADAPDDYGDAGQYVGMNDDEDELTWITPPAASAGFSDFVGVVTEQQELDFSAAPTTNQYLNSFTANYDPLSFISGTSITIPSGYGGIYQHQLAWHARVIKVVPAPPLTFPLLTAQHWTPTYTTSPISRFLERDGGATYGANGPTLWRYLNPTSTVNTSYNEHGTFTYYTQLDAGDTVTMIVGLNAGTNTSITTSIFGGFITLVKVADGRA